MPHLFDRVIVVEDPKLPFPSGKLNQDAEEAKFETIPLNGADTLQMIVSGNLEIEQENLVLFAADGRHDPRDVGRILLSLERGNDMVVASRFILGGGRKRPDQMSRYRSVGNRVFTLLANLIFYGNLSDCLSQFRAVKRSKLMALKLEGKGLPLYYRLSIRAMKRGWRVAEIPTTEFVNPRVDNYRKIMKSIVPVFSTLLSEWLRPDNQTADH